MRTVCLSDIISLVCETLRVPLEDLHGSGRHRVTVFARGMICYLGRRMTHSSYPELARALARGTKGHTTAIGAERRIVATLGAVVGNICKDPAITPELAALTVEELAERFGVSLLSTFRGSYVQGGNSGQVEAIGQNLDCRA